MTRPGFRGADGPRGRGPRAGDMGASADRTPPGVSGVDSGPARTGPDAAASPFTHAQILHLMRTEFSRSRRHSLPLACLMLEVDHLRDYALRHGDDVRRAANEALSRFVAKHTRGGDHLGLLSEGRYLLLLPHTGGEEAQIVAQRFLEKVRDLELDIAGSQLPVTLSVGIAAVEAGGGDNLFFDVLVSQAEAAVQHAVSRGGDVVVEYQASGGRGSEGDAAKNTAPGGDGAQ